MDLKDYWQIRTSETIEERELVLKKEENTGATSVPADRAHNARRHARARPCSTTTAYAKPTWGCSPNARQPSPV